MTNSSDIIWQNLVYYIRNNYHYVKFCINMQTQERCVGSGIPSLRVCAINKHVILRGVCLFQVFAK